MKKKRIDWKYVSRLFRGRLLRFWLRICLAINRLEALVHPAPKGDSRRVLFIVFGGLGDCLLFDPAFRRIKEQWPGVRIDVLSGCFEAMWERFASIDHLMYFQRRTLKTPWKYYRMFRQLWRNRYDCVVEGLAMMPDGGTWSIFTSLIIEATGAPERIGRHSTGRPPKRRDLIPGFVGVESLPKSVPHSGSNRSWAAKKLTRILDLPSPEFREKHEAAYLVETMGIRYERKANEPQLNPHLQHDTWARSLVWDEWADKDDTVIGVLLETTYPLKRWPEKNFVNIMERGLRDGFKFILLGLVATDSRTFGNHWPGEQVMNLCGMTSLAQLIAVIGQCKVFLAGDSGPAHIAQAMGIPTVVLFGPSNEKEFGPSDVQRNTLILPEEPLLCRPCVLGPCIRGQSCMHLISAETVYVRLCQVIQNNRNVISAGAVQQSREMSSTRPHVLMSI